MQDLSLLVENHEYRKSEPSGIVQPFHQGLPLLHLLGSLRLTRIVIHMDILEVLVNHLTDGCVIRDEVGKLQAPGAPVTAYLTYHELPFGLRLRNSLINLLYRVDFLIIHLLQTLCGLFRHFTFHARAIQYLTSYMNATHNGCYHEQYCCHKNDDCHFSHTIHQL